MTFSFGCGIIFVRSYSDKKDQDQHGDLQNDRDRFQDHVSIHTSSFRNPQPVKITHACTSITSFTEKTENPK